MLQQITIQYGSYIVLLAICCSLAFSPSLSKEGLASFKYILSWAIFIEMTVFLISSTSILDDRQRAYWLYVPYHFYIPIEYTLLVAMFQKFINGSAFKQIAKFSIFLFIVLSSIISIFIIGWQAFPGINLNIEGILLITWAVVVMFSVEPDPERPFHQLPIFWICIATIIYHSGTFVMNGLFNVLKKDTPLFNSLRLINQSLNIVLYLMILYALLLGRRAKTSMKH